MSPSTPHPFDLLVAQDVEKARLAEAALLFAADHCRGLHVPTWLRRLDRLMHRVAEQGAETVPEMIEVMRLVLFQQEGFRGNTEDYHDPRNSLLNEVLERRLGLPITLSVIWLDIAEQMGWPFAGANLPGHFMVRTLGTDEDVFVDVFAGGAVLDTAMCEAFLSQRLGQEITLESEHFAPAPKRIILMRMLTNLHGVLTERQEWGRVMRVAQRMLALTPGNPDLLAQIDMLRALISDHN